MIGERVHALNLINKKIIHAYIYNVILSSSFMEELDYFSDVSDEDLDDCPVFAKTEEYVDYLLEKYHKFNMITLLYASGLRSIYTQTNRKAVSYQNGSSSYLLPTLSSPTRNVSLNWIPQGVDNGQRIGSSVNMHNLVIKGVLQIQGQQDPVSVRVVFYVRTDNSNLMPENRADLFDNLGTTPNSMQLVDSAARKPIILYDKLFTVNTVSVSGTSYTNPCFPIDVNVDLCGLPCNYTGTSGEPTTIVDNAIYCIAFGNRLNGGLVSSQAWMNYQCKLFYTDK